MDFSTSFRFFLHCVYFFSSFICKNKERKKESEESKGRRESRGHIANLKSDSICEINTMSKRARANIEADRDPL